MTCRVKISVLMCGFYEMKPQYQSESHLRQDQPCRDRYFSEALTRKDALILYGVGLAAEREVYMDFETPEIGHNGAFFCDVKEKPILFHCGEPRARIQLHFMTTFLKGGGTLCVLVDGQKWVVLSGNSASSSGLEWDNSLSA